LLSLKKNSIHYDPHKEQKISLMFDHKYDKRRKLSQYIVKKTVTIDGKGTEYLIPITCCIPNIALSKLRLHKYNNILFLIYFKIVKKSDMKKKHKSYIYTT